MGDIVYEKKFQRQRIEQAALMKAFAASEPGAKERDSARLIEECFEEAGGEEVYVHAGQYSGSERQDWAKVGHKQSDKEKQVRWESHNQRTDVTQQSIAEENEPLSQDYNHTEANKDHPQTASHANPNALTATRFRDPHGNLNGAISSSFNQYEEITELDEAADSSVENFIVKENPSEAELLTSFNEGIRRKIGQGVLFGRLRRVQEEREKDEKLEMARLEAEGKAKGKGKGKKNGNKSKNPKSRKKSIKFFV